MRKKIKDMNDAEKVEQVANLICEFYEYKKRPSILLRSVIRHTKKDMYLKQSVRKLKILELERRKALKQTNKKFKILGLGCRKALKQNKISEGIEDNTIKEANITLDIYRKHMHSIFVNAIMHVYR